MTPSPQLDWRSIPSSQAGAGYAAEWRGWFLSVSSTLDGAGAYPVFRDLPPWRWGASPPAEWQQASSAGQTDTREAAIAAAEAAMLERLTAHERVELARCRSP